MEGAAGTSFLVSDFVSGFPSDDLLSGLLTDGTAAILFPAATVATLDGVAGAGVEATAGADGVVTADAGPVASSIVEGAGEPDVEEVAGGALFEASANADADVGGAAGAGRFWDFAGF